MVSASWSSTEALWTVDARVGESIVRFTCGFLFVCAGYYRYDTGYAPDFPGASSFRGRIVHPQHWPEDLDYTGKNVVVIGSGATAVTLVPEMAKQAAHVTMLQRSPTYVVARPGHDARADFLRRYLPARLAHALIRWKNVLLGMYFYRLCKRRPAMVKAMILRGVRAALGPDFDVDTHFTPKYNPWDQRVCLVPDGDLFAAIRSGAASVVTGRIETFTGDGIRLETGETLPADLIVTATGLELLVLGGIALTVDGRAVDPGKTLSYKGMMLSGVPNLAVATGYTNASWTLKCDLTCDYVCRLLNYMTAHGHDQCVPRNDDPDMAELPWVDFSSGYIRRAIDKFPKQGARAPWRLHQNYALDLLALKFGAVTDKAMHYSARVDA